MSSLIRVLSVVALLLLLLPLLAPLVALHALAESIQVNVWVRAAVIVFDDTSKSRMKYVMLLARSTNWGRAAKGFCVCKSTAWLPIELAVGFAGFVKYIVAPSWAMDELREWFKSHYEDRGVPLWAKEYIEKHHLNVTVKWVQLRSFYDFLWNLTRRVLKQYNLENVVQDTIVIIGDVDGVSRQYYEPPRNGASAIEGVPGWAGGKPLTFYDLSVIPKPWPSQDFPYAGTGRPVTPDNYPIVWSIDSPQEYLHSIEALVNDHLTAHLESMVLFKMEPLWPPDAKFVHDLLQSPPPIYTEKIRIHVYVVDYGNKKLVKEALNSINITRLIEYIKLTDPYLNVTVEIKTVDASRIPKFENTLRYAREVKGWLRLSYYNVLKLLYESIKEWDEYKSFKPCINTTTGLPVTDVCDYVFLVLVPPKPGYFTVEPPRRGFSAAVVPLYRWPGIGIAVYPGYRAYLAKIGLDRAIAMVLAGYLGLSAPHTLVYGRWLVDYTESALSLYEGWPSFYRPGDVSYYDWFRIAIRKLVALKYAGIFKTGVKEVIALTFRDPIKVLDEVLAKMHGKKTEERTAAPSPTAPPTPTSTRTHPQPSPTTTATVTSTEASTSTTATSTSTITLTATAGTVTTTTTSATGSPKYTETFTEKGSIETAAKAGATAIETRATETAVGATGAWIGVSTETARETPTAASGGNAMVQWIVVAVAVLTAFAVGYAIIRGRRRL